jgi:hypothetical protein
VGISLGLLIPGLFVNSQSTSKNVAYLCLSEAAWAAVVSTLALIFLRNAPQRNIVLQNCVGDKLNAINKVNDPFVFKKDVLNKEIREIRCNTIGRPSYFADLRLLFTNKQFILLAFVTSLEMANFNTFLTTFEGIILPFNFTSQNASELGFVISLFGCIVSLVCGALLDRSKEYNKMLLMVIGYSTVSYMGFYVCLYLYSYAISAGWCLFLGMLVAIYGLSLDYAAFQTLPIGVASSSGVIMSGSSIVSVGELYLIKWMTGSRIGVVETSYTMAVIVSLNVIALVLVLAMCGDKQNIAKSR